MTPATGSVVVSAVSPTTANDTPAPTDTGGGDSVVAAPDTGGGDSAVAAAEIGVGVVDSVGGVVVAAIVVVSVTCWLSLLSASEVAVTIIG